MQKTIERGSEEWNAFMDVWKLYQEFAIPEENDEYWENLVKAMKDIEDKYPNSQLANQLALGVAKALDKTMKGEKVR